MSLDLLLTELNLLISKNNFNDAEKMLKSKIIQEYYKKSYFKISCWIGYIMYKQQQFDKSNLENELCDYIDLLYDERDEIGYESFLRYIIYYINPRHEIANFNLARILCIKGNYKDAIPLLLKVININWKNKKALIMLKNIWKEQDR